MRRVHIIVIGEYSLALRERDDSEEIADKNRFVRPTFAVAPSKAQK